MSSLGDKTLATTKKKKRKKKRAVTLQPSGLLQVPPNEAISATLINNFLKLLEMSENAEKG